MRIGKKGFEFTWATILGLAIAGITILIAILILTGFDLGNVFKDMMGLG